MSATDHFKSPLTVYVLWHPEYADGAKLADHLFTKLSRDVRDPFARTLGIPVYYRSKPSSSSSEVPASIPFEESEFTAVVVFVDASLLLSVEWKAYVREVLQQVEGQGGKARIFPVANDFNSFKSAELGATNYIRMYEADEREDLEPGEADGAAPVHSSGSVDEASSAPETVSVQQSEQNGSIHINITIHGRGGDAPVSIEEGSAPDPSAPDPSVPESGADTEPDADNVLRRRSIYLTSKLVHELCRLIGSPPRATEQGGTVSAKPVHLFLSHAKADGEEIAKQIKLYIEEDSSMKTFFDVNDIAPGYRFSDELKGAIESSTLICIQTDYYSTREWCLFEVITAKRLNRPVVVVNALREREARSFPYIGNVPTVRWNPRDPSRLRGVVDLALFQVLGNTYNELLQRALLKLYSVPGSTFSVGHPPELFSVLRLRERDASQPEAGGSSGVKYVLYPDPPLGDEEIRLLEDLSPDMRFITPTMLPSIELDALSR